MHAYVRLMSPKISKFCAVEGEMHAAVI